MRKDVALRLLESVESNEAFDRAAEEWLHTAAARRRRVEARPVARDPCRDGACSFRGQVGRPFMTGRLNYTPEAAQQLNELDDWERAFRVMIRNAMWRRVELVARDDLDGLALLEASTPPVSTRRVRW